MHNKSIKVMIYGLGYIGRAVVEALQEETPFWNCKLEIIGAVDLVSESRQWAIKKGIKAFPLFRDLLELSHPDVCIHTTASSMSVVVSQLRELISAKIPVVSSSEELFFPWEQNPKTTKELETLCQQHQVAVMGTGVNPGFVMDVLPAVLTQAVNTVDQIHVERVVNASTRRPPLQRKIGAGLDEPTFQAYVKMGRIGHVGLIESLDFLANYMGWKLSIKGQKVEPILAEKRIQTQVVTLKKGQVSGLHHQTWGEMDKKRVIELDLKIALDANNPGDRIVIKGSPSLSVFVDGGTPGDSATVASLLRGIPMVMQARPGIVCRLGREHF